MPKMDPAETDPNWFHLKFTGQKDFSLAEKVQHTLARVGIYLDIGHTTYITAVMFGDGLDHLNCGYCHHPGTRHTWGIDMLPNGSFDVDHFNCNQCAQERDTPLVVCYTRPGGNARRDEY